jgi:hypothetical protein
MKLTTHTGSPVVFIIFLRHFVFVPKYRTELFEFSGIWSVIGHLSPTFIEPNGFCVFFKLQLLLLLIFIKSSVSVDSVAADGDVGYYFTACCNDYVNRHQSAAFAEATEVELLINISNRATAIRRKYSNLN